MASILALIALRAFLVAVFLGVGRLSLPVPVLSVAAALLLGGALFPTLRNITRGLLHRTIDPALPVVITIAILIGIRAFSTAGIFVLILLFGDLIKNIINRKIRESLERLTVYLPHTGFIKEGGAVKEIPLADIKVGDIVAVSPGARVPVDGTLLAQHALFDESVITGESKPIAKRAGDTIPAGAINMSDYVELSAARTSEHSAIAEIRKLVEDAEKKKAPLAKFIDRYAFWTVTVVGILSVGVFLFTHSIDRALALWIAMVPVIFALIGPIAISIGITAAARIGILVKNTEAVENLTKLRKLVFDKTGTLTTGHPQVKEVVPYGTLALAERDLLALAAALEERSEHRLGKAIIARAKDLGITYPSPENVHVIEGEGIEGAANGASVVVGNLGLMRDREISLDPGIEQDLRNRAVIGETPVLVAVNGKLAGGIFMADRPRPETPEAIRELKGLHYELAMLTGDETAVGLRIAEEVGLAPGDVKAELKPEDKVRLIQEMERTEKVAMVGDGINDAPALSGATVGIAMGMGGTDLATNAASIVLVKEDFRGIPVIMRQSRFIIRVIKENLVAATVIHVVAGALAVIGAITVVQSAFFHEASSVLVLMNTARLFSISRNGSSVRTGSVPAASA